MQILLLCQSQQKTMNNSEDKTKPDIRPEIQVLIQLQQLDRRIQELQKEIRLLPDKLAELDAYLKKHHQKVDTIRRNKEETLKNRRHAEMDLKSVEERKHKLISQQILVKTNKEMHALQHEIDLATAEIDRLEDTILNQ